VTTDLLSHVWLVHGYLGHFFEALQYLPERGQIEYLGGF